MGTQNSRLPPQSQVNRRLGTKLLLETTSEMPRCLAAAMGIASDHELEKQQAFRKNENNFHARIWGPNSSVSALDLAALEAHPGWAEAEEEIIGYGGRLFRKADAVNWRELDASRGVIVVRDRVFFQVDKTAHRTMESIREWYENSHAQETSGNDGDG